MGEPLNFVAGGERLFKNYLRGLLIVLCMGERGTGRMWASRLMVDYLL